MRLRHNGYIFLFPGLRLTDDLSEEERNDRLEAEIERARKQARGLGCELVLLRKSEPTRALTDEEQSMHDEIMQRLAKTDFVRHAN